MKTENETKEQKNEKKYNHKTQVLDTGKVSAGVVTVFFTEFFNALLVIFNFIKNKFYARNNRKDKID